MNIKIYHNPRCSKSRQALALIKDSGVEPEVVEYLKAPLKEIEIRTLLDAVGVTEPRQAMRTKESVYKELGLKDPVTSNDDLISAIASHPILLERPIVVSEKGARICRPPELVKEIL